MNRYIGPKANGNGGGTPARGTMVQPGVMVPTVARAVDPQSTMHAVNQMAQVVANLAQQSPLPNNRLDPNERANRSGTPALRTNLGQSGQGPAGGGGMASFGGLPNKEWYEHGRTTEQVKIVNPNDDSQYVIVERINALTMKDPVTGNMWQWRRQKP